MHVQPYLIYNGRCEEALAFYKKALNAEVQFLLHFKDNPDKAKCPDVPGDLVMHTSFRVGETVLMASDGMGGGPSNFQGFSLSISLKDEAAAERVFAALGEGGQVQMPLSKTFFSPKFGMVADKFGVSWMVIVEQAM